MGGSGYVCCVRCFKLTRTSPNPRPIAPFVFGSSTSPMSVSYVWFTVWQNGFADDKIAVDSDIFVPGSTTEFDGCKV